MCIRDRVYTYFKFVLFRLRLLKIWCKFIANGLSYERKKRVPFSRRTVYTGYNVSFIWHGITWQTPCTAMQTLHPILLVRCLYMYLGLYVNWWSFYTSWTLPALTDSIRPVLNLLSSEGWKAELTAIVYLCKIVTGPGVEQRPLSRVEALTTEPVFTRNSSYCCSAF